MSYFTPEERALLNTGFAQILAERDARELLDAVRDAAPRLVQAAIEAVEKETTSDRRPAGVNHHSG
ncbi:hypothetical protein [Streptomyces goshikiensis]|uniref:hypothetical protein n=1 Tax=Streptomyces goshikiensis TaxID=1942 RepID=UPI0036C979B9